MVDILKNEDGQMVVKLSENYVYNMTITTADLTEHIVVIDFLRADRKSKRFSITSDEMNALADAWVQFKHTQEVAKEIERKRIAGLVEAARKRIEELGATAITIEQGIEDNDWLVRYSHKPKWDYPTDASELDSALTTLIERIQAHGLPLKVDNPLHELVTDSYTIAWSGTMPPNTTFSSGMESRYNLIAGDGGDTTA